MKQVRLAIIVFVVFNAVTGLLGVSADGAHSTLDPNTYHALKSSAHEADYVFVYRGYILSSTGYGQEARAFIRGLLGIGVPLYLNPQESYAEVSTISKSDNDMIKARTITSDQLPKWADDQRKLHNKYIVALHHTAPGEVTPAAWADYNIGRTMWEMDILPTNWGNTLNVMDELWIPSMFNVETFSKAGVDHKKLYVVGECVDEEYYSPSALENAKPLKLPLLGGGKLRSVNFLSMFNWNYRKGWDVLVEAFAKEFTTKEDVTLVIKAFSSWGKTPDDFHVEVERVLSERGVKGGMPSNILFLSSGVREADMPAFYKTFDAFVLPTRAEGWGRTTMEAMFVGLPVITTKYSGQQEFVNSKVAYVVPHVIVPVGIEAVQEVPGFEGGKWAEPSVDSLQKMMRRVFKNPKEAKKKGQTAQKYLQQKFSMTQIASKMKDRLVDIVKMQKKQKQK